MDGRIRDGSEESHVIIRTEFAGCESFRPVRQSGPKQRKQYAHNKQEDGERPDDNERNKEHRHFGFPLPAGSNSPEKVDCEFHGTEPTVNAGPGRGGSFIVMKGATLRSAFYCGVREFNAR